MHVYVICGAVVRISIFYEYFAGAIFDAICRTCAWWVLRATQDVLCFSRFCLFDGRMGWPKWPFRLGGRCVPMFGGAQFRALFTAFPPEITLESLCCYFRRAGRSGFDAI